MCLFNLGEEKNLRKRQLLSVLLVMVMVFAFTAPALAAGSSGSSSMAGIVNYYLQHKTTLDSWEEVLALRSAGQDLTKAPWQLPDYQISATNPDPAQNDNASDYVGPILGMLAVGQDPANVSGRNLVGDLVKLQMSDGSFGAYINQTVDAMIALDTAKGSYDVGKTVNYLLSQQLASGGFTISGTTADPDMTGMTLVALSNHTDLAGVPEAISKAKDCLKAIQLPDGGFSSWGAENAESTATVIRGLIACHEDIQGIDWTRNGKTMIDALYSFQQPDKSFSHIVGGGSDQIATRQALLAVAALVHGDVFYNIQNGSITNPPTLATVRVRVEGATKSLADSTVTLNTNALDALNYVVGKSNVVFDKYGMIASILGEDASAESDVTICPISWMWYVIRNGAIDTTSLGSGPSSYPVKDGDQAIFYICAFDSSWNSVTYLPVVTFTPQAPVAGQSVIIQVSAKKIYYDASYIMHFLDLTPEEQAAIGKYTVTVGGHSYTTKDGQVTIPNLRAGNLDFTVTNQNAAGYPNVVTYKGTIVCTPLPVVVNQVSDTPPTRGTGNSTAVLVAAKSQTPVLVATGTDTGSPGTNQPQNLTATSKGGKGTLPQSNLVANGKGQNKKLLLTSLAIVLGIGALGTGLYAWRKKA